ncbi:response regulator [Mucilaginibacter terrae]|nr:response regulator [Mucilaginibacter terrae]
MNNRILLVDDDKLTLNITTIILRKKGYEVETREYANGVLEQIEDFKPNLIILDAKLPDGDGRDICRHIKLSPHLQHIVVLMCSGLMDIMEAYNQQGPPDGILSKPFDMLQFINLIGNKLPLAA